ncbi:hypothetical protein FRB95_002673 [Tulasnella sp. JGI-2019a]|nr:hypothetical protein FRB95_002673 [Tulasnella sp. JGI-2019a]
MNITLASITPPPFPRITPPGGSHATVVLTPDEEKLCTLLDECTTALRETRPELDPIECRIAGGWVRDKVRLDSEIVQWRKWICVLTYLFGRSYLERRVTTSTLPYLRSWVSHSPNSSYHSLRTEGSRFAM